MFRGKRCYIERGKEGEREREREASGRQEEWTKDEEVRREGDDYRHRARSRAPAATGGNAFLRRRRRRRRGGAG